MSAAPSTIETTHNADLSRVDAHADGSLVGFAAYEVCDDGSYTFHHTEVFEGNEGKGYGQQLAQGVMDFARSEGVKIAPTCSFLRAYMRKHPETQDLLADDFVLEKKSA